MEPPLLTLVVISLGIFFQSFPLPAVSRKNVGFETPPPSSSSSRSIPSPPSPPSVSPPPFPLPPPPSPNLYRRSPPLPELPSNEAHNKASDGNVKSRSGGGGGGLNLGKKIGITFLAIAILLQVFVVGFLLIKRRKLYRSYSRH